MQDRSALMTCLLDKLGIFPIGDIIIRTQAGVFANGKELDQEQLINLAESCQTLKDNFARRLINEQLRYKATEMGIHKSTTIDELLFAKAVIWFINEENILIEKLSTI